MKLEEEALELLRDMIKTSSFSGEEEGTADLLEAYLQDHGVACQRKYNNVWSSNKYFDPEKPSILLNSHHDTVRPQSTYTRDPFDAQVEDGKLYGLGSNDAGAALVALLMAFIHFYEERELAYNLVFVASAEEECSGEQGLRAVLADLPPLDCAIVGEPTSLNMAIAEKGLLVFDGVITGTASHAAHPNDDNSIYKLPEVLSWFRDLRFDRVSEMLGEVKVSVTQVNAGKQHNVIPSELNLVVDVRLNECYDIKELADYIIDHAPCCMTARSLRNNSSAMPVSHPLVQAGLGLGCESYGSPTLSDQTALSCPSLKLGPGESKRSHTADEFIYVEEVEAGVRLYVELLQAIL